MAVWMGKVYPSTAYLMAIFALQQHFHVMTGPGTSILRGIGQPQQELFYSIPNVITVMIAMPLSYLVIGRWSIVGLGSAVVVATAISAVGFIFHVNRILDVPWRRFVRYAIAPGLVPYGLGLLFAVPASSAMRVGRWHGLAILVVVGATYAVVLAAVMRLTVLDPEEWDWFGTVWNSLQPKPIGSTGQ